MECWSLFVVRSACRLGLSQGQDYYSGAQRCAKNGCGVLGTVVSVPCTAWFFSGTFLKGEKLWATVFHEAETKVT